MTISGTGEDKNSKSIQMTISGTGEDKNSKSIQMTISGTGEDEISEGTIGRPGDVPITGVIPAHH